MRTLTMLAILALAGAAWAQEFDAPFQRQAVQMMPGLTQNQRATLFRTQGAAMRQAGKPLRRIRQIDQELRKRPQPKARELRAERGKLRRQVLNIFQNLEQSVLTAGFSEQQLQRLKAMPRGQLREERYNHSVLLEAPNLSEQQRALIERLIAATDAAQEALVAQRDFLVRGLDQDDEQKLMRRRVQSACNQQCREIDRRFWRTAYYTLQPDQMRAARELFSPRFRYIPQLQQQMYVLPGMTPSQATRIRALFTEHESEITADQAEVRRIGQKIKDKSLSKEERNELQRKNGQAYARLGKLNRDFRDALRDLLSQEQRDALNAVPPLLNIGDRGRASWEIVSGMRLRREQGGQVYRMRQEFNRERQKVSKQTRDATGDMAGAELGPESPQMMTMQMAQRGAQGKIYDLQRRYGQRLLLEILDPEQVASWVAAPTLKY